MRINWQDIGPFDTWILWLMAAHRSEPCDYFFRYVTWVGSLVVLLPAAAMVTAALLYYRYREEAMLLMFGFGGATLLCHLAKAILARPRPTAFAPLVEMPTDGSFPSAHTTQIVAFSLCLMLIIRRILPEWQGLAAAIAFLLMTAVAVSRIYLQVHFPSDVFGGVVIGVLWVACVPIVQKSL